MEIMIQFKHHTFSLGSKGYRKITHHAWNKAQEAFELLILSQTGKMKAKLADFTTSEKILLNEVDGWTLNGPTASQLDRLREADADEELSTIQPDKDSDYWADNRKK